MITSYKLGRGGEEREPELYIWEQFKACALWTRAVKPNSPEALLSGRLVMARLFLYTGHLLPLWAPISPWLKFSLHFSENCFWILRSLVYDRYAFPCPADKCSTCLLRPFASSRAVDVMDLGNIFPDCYLTHMSFFYKNEMLLQKWKCTLLLPFTSHFYVTQTKAPAIQKAFAWCHWIEK